MEKFSKRKKGKKREKENKWTKKKKAQDEEALIKITKDIFDKY